MTPRLSANLFYGQGNPTVEPGKNKSAIRAVIFADYDANCAVLMGFFKSPNPNPFGFVPNYRFIDCFMQGKKRGS
jgi:hypothetical protein